jgi:hypothetical protein
MPLSTLARRMRQVRSYNVRNNLKKHKNTLFGIEKLLDGSVENYIIKDKYILNFHTL